MSTQPNQTPKQKKYTGILLMLLFRLLFKPPLALLIPLTGICILLFVFWLDRSSGLFADQLAQKMEQVPEEDVKHFAEQLGNLGGPGVSRLVNALGSQRRSVVFAARDVLEKNFQQWSDLAPRQSAPLVLTLSRTLSEQIDSFRPTSQQLAVSWSQRILRNMLKTNGQEYPHQSQITGYCEKILKRTEGERMVLATPQLLDAMHVIAKGGEPEQSLPFELSSHAARLAKKQNGESGLSLGVELEAYDPYSSSRADLLYALYQSRQNSQPLERSRRVPAPIETSVEEMTRTILAENLPDRMNLSSEKHVPPVPVISQPGKQLGAPFEQQTQNTTILLENEEKLPQLPLYPNHGQATGKEIDILLPIEATSLGRILPDTIPHQSTVDLMRLLQHPDKAIVALAEQQLRKREYFQDAHIALALRLYNPKSELRKEILELLPRIPSVQPIPWLTELLHDPDPEIRLATLSYLATAKDRTLVLTMIERAKRDDDPRMNRLVEKLERVASLRQQQMEFR